MLNIINDLIDISKIESDQMDLNMDEVNVYDMVYELCKFFKPQAEKNGLELIFKDENNTEKPIIIADKTKLNQILSNIINNAIKYTEEGYVEVGYAYNGSEVNFYVKDTGIGIEPDLQEKIFERFRQAEVKKSRKFEGVGLGLSITKAFVELMGGNIGIESEAGKGSTFYFTIPSGRLDDKDIKRKLSDKKPQKLNYTVFNILIVEDDEISFLVLSKLLKKRNINIYRASDGKEALEKIEKHRNIDLVFMDIRMPVMDGFEAAERIREINPNIKIIAQTAFALEKDKERLLEAGFDGYISKPVHKNDIENIFSEVLKYKEN